MKLSDIPMAELKQDLNESYGGMLAAKASLALGITEYGDGESVKYRLDEEQKIINIIEAEILRRHKNVISLVWPEVLETT